MLAIAVEATSVEGMNSHTIAMLAAVATLVVAGCEHLRTKDTSVGASADQATASEKKSTMPDGARYQASDQAQR